MLRAPMTGIANYTFHIVRSLLEQEATFRCVGFGGLGWRDIDLASLQRAEQVHRKRRDPQPLAASSGALSGRVAHVTVQAATRLSRVRTVRALYRTMFRRKFAASVQSQQLDLFHAFNFLPPSDPGVPVLPVIYDLSTFRHPEFHPIDRVRWLDPLGGIIACAPMVQTISEFSKREIVSVFSYPAERIFVAPPAAAPLFVPTGSEATQRDLSSLDLRYGNFFLTVGTLEPRKNIRTLIAAYGQLSLAERGHYPLVVVGGKGWGDLNLPPQADVLRREGTLRFLGGVTDPQLRSLYEGARLLLMPSLYEGFGMPVVEALACGTAVAHSADTAMDEISAGLARRVSATDVDGWTMALRDALNGGDHADPALREARIGQARHFDWSTSARHVIAAYRQLIPG
jgi:glycosyltransferase involved in cell wall biosynthesis